MKTIMVRVKGEVEAGQLAVLSYSAPRGGCSSAKYVVAEKDTPGDVAAALASVIMNEKGEYCSGQFQAVARGAMIVVTCSDAVSDVTFFGQLGDKPENMEIETF